MTPTLTPRLQRLVDKTHPLMRECHRHTAVVLSEHDDWDGYAMLMGPVIDGYWIDVFNAGLDELQADLEK